MGYAESKTIAVEEIPVIDFGGFLLSLIHI